MYRNSKKYIIGLTLFIGFSLFLVMKPDKPDSPQPKQQVQYNSTNTTTLLVNKTHPLMPLTYQPNHLMQSKVIARDNITDEEKFVTTKTDVALQDMISDAKIENVSIQLESAYRSYALQDKIYKQYVEEQGQAYADSQSAKPGYSEHQTGLAVDLGGNSNPECNVKPCFETTPEASWLAANAHKYGFLVRYPKDKQQITGYTYEPWHVRYVGKQSATKIHASNKTLEEYFKVY